MQVNRCRILFVEDHADTLQLMLRLLTREGFDVTAASTATTARSFISTSQFDLLITDMGLPDGSGLDVLAEWKRASAGPAIIVTGHSIGDELVSPAGFISHLVKPVSFQTIRTAIAKALASSDCTLLEPSKMRA
jgi:DNA-binding NtrC family response regulator